MRRSGRYAAVLGVFTGIVCLGPTARSASAQAQGAPPAQQGGEAQGRRGQLAGMARVMGEVTAVSGSTVTLKQEDGSTVQVVTTDNTRLMKDRGPVKLSDLHPGDGVMAVGNLDAPNKTLHAAMVIAQDAAQIKAMRENLGKTYITGRVTAIDLDNAKMTVERPDHVSQTIGFDETTSFRRAVRGEGSGAGDGAGARGSAGGFGGRSGGEGGAWTSIQHTESITLADIKVGDRIGGNGALKGGVFVPAQLVDLGAPGEHRQRNNTTPGQPGNPGPGEL